MGKNAAPRAPGDHVTRAEGGTSWAAQRQEIRAVQSPWAPARLNHARFSLTWTSQLHSILCGAEMDEALIDRVLGLDPAERVRLLNIIHASLERPDDAIDETWYDEAERRLAAYKSGGVRGIPVDQVLGERPRP